MNWKLLKATSRGLSLALLILSLAVPWAASQGRPLTVSELKQIFSSGGDVVGWDEFDVPEFVASVYGPRARQAVEAILQEPSSRDNYYHQLEALTTAEYLKVGVAGVLIMDYTTGRRGANLPATLRDILRHRALSSLSMRPDPALEGFWLQVAREENASVRQAAVRGLACALGVTALGRLDPLLADPDSTVSRVASFYRTELITRGAEARACGGRASRREMVTFPITVRPQLLQRAQDVLQRIP